MRHLSHAAKTFGFRVGLVCMYGQTYSKSMDQPGKIANPACGQLNRENDLYLSAFAPENLVSRDGFGSPVSRQPAHIHTQAIIWCLLTGFLPSFAAAFIYLFKTAIRHRVSPEFIESRNCVPMAFTAESPPAQGQ